MESRQGTGTESKLQSCVLIPCLIYNHSFTKRIKKKFMHLKDGYLKLYVSKAVVPEGNLELFYT